MRQDLLIRSKYTPSQRGLSAQARRQNLKQAFVLSAKWQYGSYKSVCLLDDVITTGSTLNEIAKQLRKVGVEQIQVWGLART